VLPQLRRSLRRSGGLTAAHRCGQLSDSAHERPLAAEVKPMAAKNKRVHSTHLRASHHREELLDEARSLMAAGRVREARAVESRAGQIRQLVNALESDLRSEEGDASSP